MKNIKQEIIAISIRLHAINQETDYYPFIQAPIARHLFVKSLYNFLQPCSFCLEIKQHLNEVILILSGAKSNTYLQVPLLYALISQALYSCNQYGSDQHWKYRLKAFVAFDAGTSEKIVLPATPPFSAIVNWTGLHLDRVSTLTAEMESSTSPDLLITHSFYKHLPQNEQEQYTKLYYIHHICCYEKNTVT